MNKLGPRPSRGYYSLHVRSGLRLMVFSRTGPVAVTPMVAWMATTEQDSGPRPEPDPPAARKAA